MALRFVVVANPKDVARIPWLRDVMARNDWVWRLVAYQGFRFDTPEYVILVVSGATTLEVVRPFVERAGERLVPVTVDGQMPLILRDWNCIDLSRNQGTARAAFITRLSLIDSAERGY